MTNPFRKDSNDYAKLAAIFTDDQLLEELTDDRAWGEGRAIEMVDAYRSGTADAQATYVIKCALGSLAYKNDPQ
jgi:hypothetical protein